MFGRNAINFGVSATPKHGGSWGVACKTTVRSGFHLFLDSLDSPRARMAGRHGIRKGGD
jgi:hypothetical protein